MGHLLRFEKPSRNVAVAEGVLATLIWGSSFVFVKIGLDYMGPLTVAGLRYFLASLVLLPFRGLGHRKKGSPSLSLGLWLQMLFIGVSAYTIGNGAMFWSLKYLPATTGSFLMSLSPLLMLFAAAVWLKEIPTSWQIVGVIISLVGSGLFFASGLQPGETLGLGIVAVGQIGFLFFAISGRKIAREQQVDTLTLTAIPLAFGGGFTLFVALLLEGLPSFSITGWGIVLLLAVVNTAFAYMLYNHSLQTLTALEMNVFLGLSPLGTAFLAWILLGENLSIIQLVGMATVIAGITLVHRGSRKSDAVLPTETET